MTTTDRERLARMIDPLAFEDDTGASIGARDVAREFREHALKKADRIIADGWVRAKPRMDHKKRLRELAGEPMSALDAVLSPERKMKP